MTLGVVAPAESARVQWTLRAIGRKFLPHARRKNSNLQTGEKHMIAKILLGCAVFALAVAVTPAQMKSEISGTCAKADVEQSVPAGDSPAHMFTVAQGKCTPKGEIAGQTSKSGAYSEHRDVNTSRMKAWGVYIETYDSGDTVAYSYQLSLAVKNGVPGAGKGTYQIMSGTGKMKGIKGSGTCM
jgi:hypothetical protein